MLLYSHTIVQPCKQAQQSWPDKQTAIILYMYGMRVWIILDYSSAWKDLYYNPWMLNQICLVYTKIISFFR